MIPTADGGGEPHTGVPRETSRTVSDIGRTVDLSDWLTKTEAAAAIGVSTKAIERFTKAGKVEQRFRPQAHGPQVAVYFPDDVRRIAAARHPEAPAFVLPAVPEAARVNGRPIAAAPATTLELATAGPAGDDPLRALFAAALRAVLSQTSEIAPMSEALYLTLDQAAAFSGLSRAYVRRLIIGGALPAIRDRGWRIRRRDLERL